MKRYIYSALFFIAVLSFAFSAITEEDNDLILSYTVNPKKQDLQLYWKNDDGVLLKNFQNLKSFVESNNKTLIFAMNAGMYKKDYSPLGLFIQNKKEISPLNKSTGYGNFYLMPNGVFYITTDTIPFICQTTDFKLNKNIKYATQSGPMLVINGKIHHAFKEKSTNLNIRNGVGILPNNDIVFAMSKDEINLYNFAKYFKDLGCKNALYLDGFVSKTYFPEKNWIQTDGDFGVMIGIVK